MNDLNTQFAKKIILSGADEYDAIIIRQLFLASLITSNSFVDLNTVPYIDFDKPWWDKNIINQLSIGNKAFCGFGDLTVTANNGLRIMMFNKEMIRQYGLESPYNLVKEGNWTIDTFYNMCKDVSLDVNGDGVFDVNDQYGLLTQSDMGIVMSYSAGNFTTDKDNDNLPVISSIGNERSILALEKIKDIFSNQDNTVIFERAFESAYPGVSYRGLQATFEDKRGLFLIEVLQLAERMRATDT
jgi:hypothetical protein